MLVASTGEEALDIFSAALKEISLIVLDMTMPGMSGEKTFAALRHVRSDVPILISGGYSEVEIVSRFPSGEINRFLQKPYSAAALRERISAPTPALQRSFTTATDWMASETLVTRAVTV